ncbi:MAG: C40 family peptidase [Candidatus Thermoplasmatota archaeon]|nr:C40 family peptidase [Candidatus Thermoplasmatota archaeon]
MQRAIAIIASLCFLFILSDGESPPDLTSAPAMISVPVSNVVSEPGAGVLETQCVMGENVMVIDNRNGWTRIIALEQPSRKDERGYPGWVYSQNVTSCTFSSPVIVIEDIARVYDDPLCSRIKCTLLLGSRVDLLELNTKTAHIKLPDGTDGYIREDYVSSKTLDRSAEYVIEHMHHFLELGYLWGGTTPYGFDCSGFIYRIGKVHGYDLPRDSRDQALCGIEIDEPERGDLIFFGSNGNVTHVALYLGDREIIHAVGSSGGSRVTISSLEDYSDSLITCRRVL